MVQWYKRGVHAVPIFSGFLHFYITHTHTRKCASQSCQCSHSTPKPFAIKVRRERKGERREREKEIERERGRRRKDRKGRDRNECNEWWELRWERERESEWWSPSFHYWLIVRCSCLRTYSQRTNARHWMEKFHLFMCLCECWEYIGFNSQSRIWIELNTIALHVILYYSPLLSPG